MEVNFTLDISYSQLVVFQKGMENPFNDWENTHVDQGFAWRPGSVSFWFTTCRRGILDSNQH